MEAAPPEIIVVSDSEALRRTAADIVIGKMKEIFVNKDRFSLALSGGSTPKGLYALIAEASEYHDHVPWQRVHFFWGDERHVPPDHAESNYRMANETMLSKLPVPVENIHRVKAEMSDAEKAASEYEQELKRFTQLDTSGRPRLDCVLLGMGPDGHTASLFPETAALNEQKQSITANWVEKFHAHRITMTAPILNNADLIIFLVSGSDKAAVLRKVLEGDRQPDLFPSQLIKPAHGRLLWVVDKTAAAGLTRTPSG